LLRIGAYRRHPPRRNYWANLIRWSYTPPLDDNSIERKSDVIARGQDRTLFISRFQSSLDASRMQQDREDPAAGRPELLLEKRFLDLASVGTQQAEPGKDRALDLSRKADRDAEQVGGDLRA